MSIQESWPTTTRTRTTCPDSVEVGVPSKAGSVKVYFNADNTEDAKQRIKNALEMRKFMNEQIVNEGKDVLPQV